MENSHLLPDSINPARTGFARMYLNLFRFAFIMP